MNNTWKSYLAFKWKSLQEAPEIARKYASIFREGPMDEKTFAEYVASVGEENAHSVNNSRSQTVIGHWAWEVIKVLFFWNKEEWYWNYESSFIFAEDDY